MPDVIQWHFDAITALPPGAVQLASAPACDIQAFRLGRLAWGLQFHIETTPEVFGWWADEDAALFADYDLAEIVRRARAAHVRRRRDVAAVRRRLRRRGRRPVHGRCPSRAVPTSTSAPITDPAAIRAALAAELASARAPLPMPGLRPD